MLKAYPLGNFEPDKMAIGGTNLSIARNVYPVSDGYAPVRAFAGITPALGSPFTGGAAFVGSDGTAALLAAANGATLSAPVLGAPSTAATGGTLAAATYYYKVTALNANGETISSNEVSQATTGATSTVSLTWGSVIGATAYRVYRGTTAAGENVYFAPGNVTSFTDTGGASTAGTVPSTNSATTANLCRYSGSSWSVVYSATTTGRYRFAQFGDNIIIANGGALLSYGLLTGTAAAISGAPTATDVATVRDYVVVLGPNGNQLDVRWSQFNNSSAWTEGVNGADDQPLLSGGKGVAIVGGEYGIVLQRNAIKRMSPSGDPVLIFEFDEISSEIGCMAQGSVAAVGKMIFFLSERGFMMCDGQAVTPIGEEKFNRWFFDTYSRADIAGMYSAIDPRRCLVMWAMPGSPGRILAYNWELERAATIETGITGIFTGFTANTSLDAVDALYPGGLDAIPISLDDASLSGGNPLLLIANESSAVGTLNGTTLDALFRLENIEPTKGRRSRIRSLKPIGDMVAATATIDSRQRPGDPENSVTASGLRPSGIMPIRTNGRYSDITLGVPAGATWTFAQGIELEFEPGETR